MSLKRLLKRVLLIQSEEKSKDIDAKIVSGLLYKKKQVIKMGYKKVDNEELLRRANVLLHKMNTVWNPKELNHLMYEAGIRR